MTRLLHPIRAIRHWWRTFLYAWGCDPQTSSDRITACTGWPEWEDDKP